MKIFFKILIIGFSLLSCKTSDITLNVSSSKKKESIKEKSYLTVKIKAINLSEDISRISSKNDEILLLIYQNTDSLYLNDPLLTQKILFDSSNREKNLNFKTSNSLDNKGLLLFCLEQDSEIPIEQIDPVIRIKHKEIILAFNQKKYNELEKYIGDEDIIGIKSINNLDKIKSIDFTFEGIHKIDSYEYQFSIE